VPAYGAQIDGAIALVVFGDDRGVLAVGAVAVGVTRLELLVRVVQPRLVEVHGVGKKRRLDDCVVDKDNHDDSSQQTISGVLMQYYSTASQ